MPPLTSQVDQFKRCNSDGYARIDSAPIMQPIESGKCRSCAVVHTGAPPHFRHESRDCVAQRRAEPCHGPDFIGAHVTVLSHSPGKRDDALKLGADDFLVTRDAKMFDEHARRFDFIIDTISAEHDYNAYLKLLRRDGIMVLVGIPDPQPLSAFPLVTKRRRLAGSMIGGIRETQEMLDFCAKHGVAADVEMIPIQKVNEAYERMLKNDVRYRFVIDLASLQ